MSDARCSRSVPAVSANSDRSKKMDLQSSKPLPHRDVQTKRKESSAPLIAAPLSIKPEPLALDGITMAQQLAAQIAEEEAAMVERAARLQQLKASQQLLSQSALLQPLQHAAPSGLNDLLSPSTQEEIVVNESEVAFLEEIVKGPRMSFQPDYVGLLKLQEEKKKAALEELEQLKAKKTAKDVEIAAAKAKAGADAKKAREEARAREEKQQKMTIAITQMKKMFGDHNVLGQFEDLITIQLPNRKHMTHGGCAEDLVVSTKHIATACRKHLATLDIKKVKFLAVTSCQTSRRPMIPKKYREKVTPFGKYVTVDHENSDLHLSIRRVGRWVWKAHAYSTSADVARKLSGELPLTVHTKGRKFVKGALVIALKPAKKVMEQKRQSLEDEQKDLIAAIAMTEEDLRICEKSIEIKIEMIKEQQQMGK